MIAHLPVLLVVTDGRHTSRRSLPEVIAAAVDGGARAVLFREKHLPNGPRRELARALAAILESVGGLLVVASDPTFPADGVHLAAADPFPEPFPESRPRLIGRSCHSRTDVEAAAAQGCAYATLSPIFPSPSKPGYGPILTASVLRDLPLPTWALGGVDATNAHLCMAQGATGVAVMGAIMSAPDPAATTAAILEAVRPQTRSTPGRSPKFGYDLDH